MDDTLCTTSAHQFLISTTPAPRQSYKHKRGLVLNDKEGVVEITSAVLFDRL